MNQLTMTQIANLTVDELINAWWNGGINDKEHLDCAFEKLVSYYEELKDDYDTECNENYD